MWPAPPLTLLSPPDPRSCTGACSVRMASPWTTSGRLSEVGSPQIQVTVWPGAAPPSQGLRALALPRTDKGQRGQASPSSPTCWIRAPPSWGGTGQEAGVSAVVTYLTPSRGLPGGPVVWTPRFHCRGLGSIPGQGITIRHTARCSWRKKNLKNILLPALGVIQIERGLAGRSAGRPLVTQNPASWAPCPPWKAAPSPSP